MVTVLNNIRGFCSNNIFKMLGSGGLSDDGLEEEDEAKEKGVE